MSLNRPTFPTSDQQQEGYRTHLQNESVTKMKVVELLKELQHRVDRGDGNLDVSSDTYDRLMGVTVEIPGSSCRGDVRRVVKLRFSKSHGKVHP